MKFSCELSQAQWLSQPKSIVTMTEMWTKQVGKKPVQWDRAAQKLMSKCIRICVASFFAGSLRDK